MSSDDIGGGHRFPTTRGSIVTGFRSDDPELRARSFETLVRVYWRPVYKYVRLKWRRTPEDCQDLTQAFFVKVLEKDYFAGYDARKARFRTFLRVCLDGFLANEEKAARRRKRGGDVVLLPLEVETIEAEIAAAGAPAPESLDRCFDAEWARSLFMLAVEALRDECARRDRQTAFRIFESYDLDPPDEGRLTYETLAARFSLPVTQVTNHLAFARREFRRLLLEKLREITASDEEFRREARSLIGTEPE